MIVCGADNGGLLAYSADQFIKGEAECLLFKNNKHTGAVKALDFNPFQVCIVTGAIKALDFDSFSHGYCYRSCKSPENQDLR